MRERTREPKQYRVTIELEDNVGFVLKRKEIVVPRDGSEFSAIFEKTLFEESNG